MNPSDSMAEALSKREPAVAVPPAVRLAWSIRRELWENRSIYLAPTVVAAVFLAGFVIGLYRLPDQVRTAATLGPMEQHAAAAVQAAAAAAVGQPYVIVALMLMGIDLIVAVVYCLDALYGERRDRSILFWKSLPISDLTTVLAKASIPILVLPLVTTAVTVAAQFIMLLASSGVLAASGMSAAPLWSQVPFFKFSAINFFHLVVFHGIWYAPFYGWLLLASAWAKRAPLLWATLPPVAIAVAERLALNTSYFATTILSRFTGGWEPSSGAAGTMGGTMMTMDMMAPDAPGRFLISPGLWIGLVVTAVFLVAAVRLRRRHGPV